MIVAAGRRGRVEQEPHRGGELVGPQHAPRRNGVQDRLHRNVLVGHEPLEHAVRHVGGDEREGVHADPVARELDACPRS
jgi:hypothetical protein